MTDELVEWRSGVVTRMLASAATGARGLCLFEQRSDPGTGAPPHAHEDVEEAVYLLEGDAEFTIEGESRRVGAGEAVIVPKGAMHSFTNVGTSTLRTLAVFPSATPTVRYDAEPDVVYEIGGFGSVRRDAHRAVKG